MKIIKNRLVQIVILAMVIKLMYSAIAYVIWQTVSIPQSEEMNKVD